jgi:hypothetical protein
MSEFERYVGADEIGVKEEAGFRVYQRGSHRWRLAWVKTGGAPPQAVRGGDTVLSEVPLTEPQLAAFRAGGVHWLDLAGRSRSREGSPLTEELHSFLGRYGIRLPRD